MESMLKKSVYYIKIVVISLALRKERRLRVFQNGLLRRIFGAARRDVIGQQRKQHIDGLHHSYSSPNMIRMIK
jgi:hypothetical protein